MVMASKTERIEIQQGLTVRVARLRVLGSANGFGTPRGARPPMNIFMPGSWRGRSLGGLRHRCLWGVGAVTLGLGGVWIPPEGIPPLCSPFPFTRAPLPVRVYPNGRGTDQKATATRRFQPLVFVRGAPRPGGWIKANLTANHFGSSLLSNPLAEV